MESFIGLTVKNQTEIDDVSNKKNANRYYGIDFLKIVLFVMVVSLHILNPSFGGGLKYAIGPSQIVFKFIESLSIVAVDCFLLITGFFMCKKTTFSIKKSLYIYLMYISYNLICYFLELMIFNHNFSFLYLIKQFIPCNYFINFYCFILLLAPLLNKFFLINFKTQFIYLMCFLSAFVLLPTITNLGFDLFGVEMVDGLSFLTLQGEINGYTIVMFMICYLVGGFISNNYAKFKGKYFYILIYLLLTIVITLFSIKSDKVWNYDNIFVFLSSCCLFIFFSKIKLPKCNFITKISMCSLGVFILHTSNFVINYIFPLFKVESYVGKELLSSVIFFLIFSIIISFGCAIIDFILRFITNPIKKKIDNIAILNKNILEL